MLNFKNRPWCRQLPVTPRSQPRWVIHTFLDLSFCLTAHLPLWTPRSQSTPTRVVTRIPRIQCGKTTPIYSSQFSSSFSRCGAFIQIDLRCAGHGGISVEREGNAASSPTDMPPSLWTSAGCYFNLITPCRFCCTPSSLDQQTPAGGITDWIHPLLIWLTGSDKTFQSSSSLIETLQPNNWGASLQEGSGGRVRWLWDKAES